MPSHFLSPGYGPVDQGAFLQYYEHEIKGKPINKASAPASCSRGDTEQRSGAQQPLPPAPISSLRLLPVQVFNYKIYHAFRPTARIVHMHG